MWAKIGESVSADERSSAVGSTSTGDDFRILSTSLGDVGVSAVDQRDVERNP